MIKALQKKAEELKRSILQVKEEIETTDSSPESIKRKATAKLELEPLENAYQKMLKELSEKEEELEKATIRKEEAETAYLLFKAEIDNTVAGLVKDITEKISRELSKLHSMASELYKEREDAKTIIAELEGKNYYPAQDQPVALIGMARKRISESVIISR